MTIEAGHMQIGQIAARTELSLEAIRHFDELGLVTPRPAAPADFGSTPKTMCSGCW